MSCGEGPFVHLQLVESFYRTFEVPPVPMPIRLGTMEEFAESRLELTVEVLATELLAYLEERPAERLRYRVILGEMALSIGTEAGKVGQAVKASRWLLMASEALPDNLPALVNYAVALVQTRRHADALEVCARVRALPEGLRKAAATLHSIESECRQALADGSRPLN